MLDGAQNIRWVHCTAEQRMAVAALLEHLFETRAEWLESDYCLNDFFQTLEIWSESF